MRRGSRSPRRAATSSTAFCGSCERGACRARSCRPSPSVYFLESSGRHIVTSPSSPQRLAATFQKRQQLAGESHAGDAGLLSHGPSSVLYPFLLPPRQALLPSLLSPSSTILIVGDSYAQVSGIVRSRGAHDLWPRLHAPHRATTGPTRSEASRAVRRESHRPP